VRRWRLAVLVAAVAAVGVASAVALGSGSRNAGLGLVRVASGLHNPVYVTSPRSERGRLYVVEQAGTIRVLVSGKVRSEPFLDIRDRVKAGGEQGLLGLAFDPAYAKNRMFYVDYTDTNGDTRVVAYRSDGTRAIPSSARQLLFVDQPYPNHNGGMVTFGPDGKLYVGMGDGGSAGDPENRAQNPNELLGKLLRLDPRGRSVPQVAELGLRNPWRFSFDRKTGDLYIGDVGQGEIEEVDYVPAGTRALLNFGWRVYEGRRPYQPGQLGPGRLTMPIAQYSHQVGCSIAGGYVYRGKAVPSAVGRYFYGDSCSDRVWSLKVRNGKATGLRLEPFTVSKDDYGFGLVSFGEDADGELYLVSIAGTIYRLRQ
jgi:glucose/arabinose dehydrogenase